MKESALTLVGQVAQGSWPCASDAAAALPAIILGMNAPGLDHLPEEHADTWASETLPMSVRRELLQRELKKLGFGRNEAGASSRAAGSRQQQQQQQPQAAAGHPQADAATGGHSS